MTAPRSPPPASLPVLSYSAVVIVTSDDEPEPETDDNGGFVANGDYLGCYGDDDKDSILEFAYEDENDLTPEVRACGVAL